MGSEPIFVCSLLSAHCLARAEAFFSFWISFLCFSFSDWENRSFRDLFSHQLEKLPFCISMEQRFRTRTWSIQASNKSLSWETRINPFLCKRYCFTLSKWFVGSSISKKSFSPENKIASITFVRSPWLRV